MTRYMIASSLLASMLLAAVLYRARTCADLADDCWQPWRDYRCDHLDHERELWLALWQRRVA